MITKLEERTQYFDWTDVKAFINSELQKAAEEARVKVVEEMKDWVNKSQQQSSDKWNHESLMKLWNYLSSLTDTNTEK